MSADFPEMMRTSRHDAGLTFRQLKAEIDRKGKPVSITLLNLVEKNKLKPTYELAFDTATATNNDVEELLKAAFLHRVQWSADRERQALRSLAREKGLSEASVDRITSFAVTNSSDKQ